VTTEASSVNNLIDNNENASILKNDAQFGINKEFPKFAKSNTEGGVENNSVPNNSVGLPNISGCYFEAKRTKHLKDFACSTLSLSHLSRAVFSKKPTRGPTFEPPNNSVAIRSMPENLIDCFRKTASSKTDQDLLSIIKENPKEDAPEPASTGPKDMLEALESEMREAK
jgi:hypothetical protein